MQNIFLFTYTDWEITVSLFIGMKSDLRCFFACLSVTSLTNYVTLYSLLKGGRGQIKQKKKTVPQKVTIAKIPRAKKKYVTRVCGLATFGELTFVVWSLLGLAALAFNLVFLLVVLR